MSRLREEGWLIAVHDGRWNPTALITATAQAITGGRDHPALQAQAGALRNALARRGNRESYVPDEPNAQGYYEAKVTMGTRPDGTLDRRHVERKSKAARNRAVRELERKRDAGQITKAGRARTVSEMLTRHLDVVLPQRGRAP